MKPQSDRALAKACGAAQRAYRPVADLARLTDALPLKIARQGNAVLEELDLLRFYLHEATLEGVINPYAAPTAVKRVPAKSKR